MPTTTPRPNGAFTLNHAPPKRSERIKITPTSFECETIWQDGIGYVSYKPGSNNGAAIGSGDGKSRLQPTKPPKALPGPKASGPGKSKDTVPKPSKLGAASGAGPKTTTKPQTSSQGTQTPAKKSSSGKKHASSFDPILEVRRNGDVKVHHKFDPSRPKVMLRPKDGKDPYLVAAARKPLKSRG